MTTYPADQWADICEFAGVWQRGQKCSNEINPRLIIRSGAASFHTPYCEFCHQWLPRERETYMQLHHPIPPPDQSDPKIRAWVAMECLRKGIDVRPMELDVMTAAPTCWQAHFLGHEWFFADDPAAAIFTAVAAYLKEQGR